MPNIKTSNLLPQVFRTDTNKKFLNATLDQLVSRPELKKINGYIGRIFAPTTKTADTYLQEDSLIRQNYQLEPSVVVTNKSNNIDFFGNYIDLLQQIQYLGGDISDHNRLFTNDSYSFDGLIDLDKFVNFNQYYWLPDGPDPVNVLSSGVPITQTFTVTRDSASGAYKFTTYGSAVNPQVLLAHGGVYQFVVNQPGYPFWIQSDPGISGTRRNQPNTTSRDILGVTNNGADLGTVTFRVPSPTAQNNYSQMISVDQVDFALDVPYSEIANKMVSYIIETHSGFDGIQTNLQGKKVIFLDRTNDEEFWTSTGIFDYEPLDTVDFENSSLVPANLRSAIWTIQLLPDDSGNQIVRLVNPVTVAEQTEKVFIKNGENNANNEYYVNRDGYWDTVPAVTASNLYLYYQDGISNSYAGRFKMVDPVSSIIDVETEILGKPYYKSPNDVTFTAGLKVVFDTNVVPATYADTEYYVEGVGEAIRLVPVAQMINAEDTAGNLPEYISINKASLDRNAWSRHNRWFHIDVINATAEYLNNIATVNQSQRALRPIIEFEADIKLFNYGTIGKDRVNIIELDMVTNAFVQVEGQLADSETVAVVTVNGNDITFNHGDRVIFAADTDITTRNKIYVANIVDLNSDPLNRDWRIHLELAQDSDVLNGHTALVDRVVSKSGVIQASQYYFDGSNWVYAQQKSDYNQAPFFDVVTNNDVGLDSDTFLNSSFTGTNIFAYKVGTGTNDTVLGFPLSYRNFNNVGDIEFNNSFDNDTFTYDDAGVTITEKINSYYLKQITGIESFELRNVWQKNTEQTKQYQLFSYTFTGETNYFEIDILPEISIGVPTITVYINNETLDPTTYAIVEIGARTLVRISVGQLTVNDLVTIKIYSKSVSEIGFYEVPLNLDLNSINSGFDTLTLGQMRNHLITMSHNSNFVVGPVPGISNLRDIHIKQQGGSILQHAAPAIYSNLFLLDKNLNFVKSLDLAQKEYTKFKNKFLELSITTDLIDTTDIPGTVDALLTRINRVKNSKFPWYYSDMVPYGSLKQTLEYQILNPQLRRYEIATIFNDTVLGNRAVLVYYHVTQKDQYGATILDENDNHIVVERRQLIKDQDFVFEQDRPAIRLLDTTAQIYNDYIVIEDYSNTEGSYIPETPSKLGLYPKFIPEIFVDNTYVESRTVIQGHDGSLTPSFGDYRDDLLLELECRIYNNIKVSYANSLVDIYDHIPGKFRDTDYTLDEFNTILTQSFLKWVGTNRVDYTTNSVFNANNPFTWNYKNFRDTIDGENLPGTWRAVYKYFYDTDRPHTHPWEMLGFSQKPAWWDDHYGIAPYTNGNLVMWEELEAGYIYGEDRHDTRFARPGLVNIIPVDDAGNLRSPEAFLVANYNSAKANASYAVGDISPTENAWRRSSEFPFVVQLMIALTKPGFYFGSLMNVDRYNINTNLGQHALDNNLQRITPTQIHINGLLANNTIQRTAGYINWIGDYLTNLGLANPGVKINDYLTGLDVRLSYKAAGFVDKNYIKVLAEQSSPTSTNESVIIPDDNYKIFLNKSTPVKKINYSAVIVEKSAAGWTVSGYDLENPYFMIIPSLANNNLSRIQVNKSVGIIYQDYQNYKVKIPYGFEFNSRQQVVDFLISYGRYLVGQGMRFDQFNQDLQAQQDWVLSAKEFLTWEQQGWRAGSLLILSPVIGQIVINIPVGTIDYIENSISGSKILDQNFNVIKNTQFTVLRVGEEFKLTANYGQTIALAQLNVVQYEHALIFDNTTLFNDIVYKPELGNRQYRLKIVGNKTAGWNGQLDIPGFIYNNEVVDEWQSGRDYQKGTLVVYKNNYYTALENVIANTDFDSTKWQQINKDQIKTGLLPNFNYNAQLLENIYDINNQPANSDINQFSNSLIGFRERNYLTDLGLSVETQAKFYSGYIKQKGTKNALDALSTVELSNLRSTINTYEEWGIRVGEYGSIDSNDFVEVTLSEELYGQDPSTFALINISDSVPDQIVGVRPQDLYRRPNNYNPLILQSETIPNNNAKPIAAGYVNLSDVDATIYDMQDYASLNGIINDIGSGYKIWVAKDFDNDWNVYRVCETNNFATGFEYNLNGLVLMTTFDPHGFSVGSIVAMRNFDPDFDGFYRVFELVNENSFYVVAARNADIIQEIGQVYGSGLLFLLTSVRAGDATGIIDLEPSNYWKSGDRLWIDNDRGTGEWSVYEKNDAWESTSRLSLGFGDYATGSQYGAAVRLNENSTVLVVGAPGIGTGIVRTFSRSAAGDQFSQATAIQPAVDYGEGFGSSIDIGLNVVVVGASATLADRGVVFIYDYSPGEGSTLIQALRLPAAETPTAGDAFGYSVTISRDDRWIYVGAPGKNKVYAYASDSLPTQTDLIFKQAGTYDQTGAVVTASINGHGYNVPTATYSQSGTTVTVTASSHSLKVGQRIFANITSGTSTPGVYYVTEVPTANSYKYTASASASTSGAAIVYPQVNVYVTSGTGVTGWANVVANVDPDTFTLSSNTSTTTSGTFTVTSYTLDFKPESINTVAAVGQNRIYIPDIDFTLNDREIDFNSIAGSDTINISESSFYRLTANIEAPAGYTGQFGSSVKTGTEGAQIVVGAPETTVNSSTLAGSAFVYNRSIEGFYTDGVTATFIARRTIGTVYRVTVNGIEKRVGTDFTKVGNTINFISIPPGGQFVQIETNQFSQIARLGNDIAALSARFGKNLDFCPNNCSIYIAAPTYTRPDYFAGRVYRYVNQGRVYGTILGQIANPYLQANGTYTQSGILVTVSAAAHGFSIGDVFSATINSGAATSGTYKVASVDTKTVSGTYSQTSTTVTVTQSGHNISSGDTIVVAITGGSAISGTYVVTSTNATQFTYTAGTSVSTSGTLNAVSISNSFTYLVESPVTSSGSISIVSERLRNVVTVGNSMFINGIEVEFSGTTVQAVANDIVSRNIPGISALVENGQLRINSASTVAFSMLSILPGSGSDVFANLGLTIYELSQAIEHPYAEESEYFGSSLRVTDTAGTLFVGSQGADTRIPTNIDTATTLFDQDTTRFADFSLNSGTVYVFDYITTPNDSVTDPGQFTFVQQLSPESLLSEANFGVSIDVNRGFAIIGADFDDNILTQAGEVYVYNNLENKSSWNLTRHKDVKVDIDSLTRLFIYDKIKQEILVNLDVYDPLKGKILGIAEQDLDFISSYDPARYNQDNPTIDINTPAQGITYTVKNNNVGTVPSWGDEHVGELWWDLDAVRYIDYEQDSLTYRSKNWGRMFPGSTIQICEWIASDVPPGSYVGSGAAKYPDNTRYSISYYVDRATGIVKAKYYYWIVNPSAASSASNKTQSASSIASIIENPQTSGVSYAAPIRHDSFNLYSIARYLSGNDSILQISYSIVDNENIIHSEYELISENSSTTRVPDKILLKLVDSLCGVTVDGYLVPDPTLPDSQKYGIASRPRQSMFKDRITAVRNYVGYVNDVLALVPIVLEFDNKLFYTQDPVPAASSGKWDMQTPAYETLSYLDTSVLPVGYRVLVTEDTRHSELWTISELDSNKQFRLIQIQTYRTDFYISLTDWYASDFDRTEQITWTIDTNAQVGQLTLTAGDTILVNNDGSGRFAYYRVNTDLTLSLVGIENGTVQLKDNLWNYVIDGASFDTGVFDSSRFDLNPVDELRSIVTAIFQDIFVKSLSTEFGKLIFALINYILSEQKTVDWIFKTSFINVLHKIRKLDQYPNFVRDNQTYYQDYINEVKPYRTQIREYLLNYDGSDTIDGNVTDFDLPGYYDTLTSTYRSPNGTGINDSTIYQSLPYQYWLNNYKYQVGQIEIFNAGIGYVDNPSVTIAGGGGTGATATAQIDFATGSISSITILNPGTGYTSAPTVIINGDGSRDTGAILTPYIGINGATPWDANVGFYPASTLLSYQGNTYVRANANTTAAGYSYAFPNWSNAIARAGRINANIVLWTANTSYNTSTFVLSFNNNVYIANTEVINANLFANSTTYFPLANVVRANTANLTFNFGNVSSIDVSGVITGVEIVNNGRGFTNVPYLEIIGSGTGGNISCNVDAETGIITSVGIVSGGTGYVSGNTSIRVIDSFTNASAVARLRNVFYRPAPADSYNLVRSFETDLKFDRITYSSNVSSWSANAIYYLGETLSYNGDAWRANTVQPWANVIYPSTTLVQYNGAIYAAANTNSSVSSISLTFGNVFYPNPTVVPWTSGTTYAANTIVSFGSRYYINANSSANISGVSYTFAQGTRTNANVEVYSNTATYSLDVVDFNKTNVFSYLGNVYAISNIASNATGRSFSFPAWSNAAPRAGRINANVVLWEPGTVYDTANIVLDYLGNVIIANTQVLNANLYANSARYFSNANAVAATTSNLTFSTGNVQVALSSAVTFNLGNVIQGTPDITFNTANARTITSASVTAWNGVANTDTGIIYSYNNQTFISANANSTAYGQSFNFPKWANGVSRAARINANVVAWEPNTIYNTTNIVLSYLGNVLIANTEIVNANLFANSATYFANANAVVSTSANVTWNTSNVMPVTATIYPSATLALDANVTVAAGTYVGILNSSGRANVSANVTSANLVFVSNTTGTLQAGTGAWLYRANVVTGALQTNLGVRVFTTTSVFDVTKYTELDAASFDNANDRTMAYYQPGVGMPAKDLAQIFLGIEYPGVQIQSPRFDSNVSVTTNVLRFFATNSTIQTTDISAFNFVRADLGSGQTITLSGSTYNNGDWTIGTVTDKAITVFSSNVGNSLVDEDAGDNLTVTYYNENNPFNLDTVIESNYTDTSLGLRPEDINIDGGKYVDTYSSHAPEELVPGRVFDNLNIEVYTLMRSGTANVGYRMTHSMISSPDGTAVETWPTYYRINGANTTVLTANLNYTDSNVYVSNALRLPAPNPDGARPGIVYINGEKIYYYRNIAREVKAWVANVVYAATDIVSYLGNNYVAANANVTVTGTAFNFGNVKTIAVNVLTQIRRGVDGTGIANTHAVGSRVVDSGLDQLVPGRAHEFTWLNASTLGGDAFQTESGDFIVDNFASNIVTASAEQDAVTDGAGLEGSGTLQARFIKLATVN